MFRHSYIDQAGKLLCDVSEYVKRHNVVHKTPPVKVQDGLPLGNGFMGGLVYQTDRELCMRINRPDSFDYGPRENFGAWGYEWEEKSTALANCGVIKISDGTPAFAWEYLNDYDMTLELGRAELNMTSDTPFAKYRAKGYGSLEYGCIVWEVTGETEEPVERTVDLERYGTRAYFHYYETVSPDTARRLYGVASGTSDGCMYVTQELNGCKFTTAACVVAEGVRYILPNKRAARCVLPASCRAEFRVYITTALSRNGGDTVSEAIGMLQKAVAAGERVRESSLAWWKEYWNRSFIHIENDFAENVYYENRYQFGCSGLGAFPPSVFASLWSTMGDCRNWGHYYHWNDQMQFWPVDVWNHPELIQNYFAYRRGMLARAQEDCRNVQGVEGAWYSDIAEAGGYQAVEPDTRRNLTCGGMISMQMYRHYKHYPDREFLLNTAYPVMKSCADMYMNLFVKGEDGRYHLHDVTPLEGYLYLDDTMSDWSASRFLFKALIDVADEVNAPEELREKWRDALENMYTPPTVLRGGREAVAVGRRSDGTSFAKECSAYPDSGMGAGHEGTLMCVFPGSMYGMNTPDEPYDEIIRNSMEAERGSMPTVSYDTIMHLYTRYGMAEEFNQAMAAFFEMQRVTPNGLTWFESSSMTGKEHIVQRIPRGCKHTDWNNIHEKGKKDRFVCRADRFDHFYSEAEATVSTSINESLLQSWEGKVRVFPANNDADALFRLHAEGDFMVTSQKDKGIVRFITAESNAGARLNVVSPFEKMECVRVDGKEVPFEMNIVNGERVISLDTEKGKTYVIFSKACHIDGSYPTYFPTDVVNDGVKKCGVCQIGLERDF